MTFQEFERRVERVPDLELGWPYWNVLLPQTAPGYFAWRILFALAPLLVKPYACDY